MAVLVGIADAHHAAVGEPHAPRALDLQEERFDRIVDVRELLHPCDRRLAALDVGARPVRHDALALDAAAHALVLELGIELGQVDRQQIVGRARTAARDGAPSGAAAGEQRLVVAGDHPGVAAVGGRRPGRG